MIFSVECRDKFPIILLVILAPGIKRPVHEGLGKICRQAVLILFLHESEESDIVIRQLDLQG